MIEPTKEDIGRVVIYHPTHLPLGKGEVGIITSFNPSFVFVRYQNQSPDADGKATRRADLEWQ